MKRSLLLLWLLGAATVGSSGPGVGMRVLPPSARGFSTEAIRDSGERGGQLLSVGTNFTAVYNETMGWAMELWNAHRWNEAIAVFQQIRLNQPDSPWAAEAELHEACYLKYNARYDEAEERFLSVLEKYPDVPELRLKVLRYLPHLYAQTGRYQTALDLLEEMARLSVDWQERQFVENYRRIYTRALRRAEEAGQCGPKALALALAAQNDAGQPLRNCSWASLQRQYPWLQKEASHPEGFSLQELAVLSNGQPVEMDLESLRAALVPGRPVLVYLKRPPEPRCFRVFAKPARPAAVAPAGHFVVVETVGQGHVDLLDPDVGRIRWPLGHFLYHWSGTALRLPTQRNLPGRPLSPERAAALRGGCCGHPPPDPSDECDADGAAGPAGAASGPGSLGGSFEGSLAGLMGGCGFSCGGVPGSGPGGSSGFSCCEEEEGQESDPGPGSIPDPFILSPGFGAPTYRFGLASANLQLKDIPLWTTDAKGPRLNLQLIYNRVATHRMARHTNANYQPFGNKWHCNLFSHYVLAPDNSLEMVLPGGRIQRFYSHDGQTYVPADFWNRNRLSFDGSHYVLEFDATGNRWYFSSSHQRLEQIVDKYGNALQFHYDQATGRLAEVTDAIGRWFRFFYNAQGFVTNVASSCGRSAFFSYQNGDLVSITDMGGQTTTIHYDANRWPVRIVYPSTHAWHFGYETNILEQFPGADPPVYWVGPFRITVTNPLDQIHQYFYTGAGGDDRMPITIRDQTGNTWLYGARRLHGSAGYGSTLRTYYTGVNAVLQHEYGGEYCVYADQWTRTEFDAATGQPLWTAIANTNFRTPIGFVCPDDWVAHVLITNAYDSRGNLLSSTLLTNSFNEHGQLISTTVVGTWTNRYDERGNLIWTRNPLG